MHLCGKTTGFMVLSVWSLIIFVLSCASLKDQIRTGCMIVLEHMNKFQWNTCSIAEQIINVCFRNIEISCGLAVLKL